MEPSRLNRWASPGAPTPGAGERTELGPAWDRAILDKVNDGIFVHDVRTGRVLDVNQRSCEMFGYPYDELCGSAAGSLGIGVPPYTEADAERWVRKAAEEGPQLFQWRARRRDGTAFWVEVSLKTATVRGKERLLAVVRDITERKRAEQALQESERALATLMGNLPGMAYRCANDPHWTMQFVSQGCTELTGHPAEALVGNRTVSYASLIHPEDREMVWEGVQAGVREKRPFRLTYRIRTAEGVEKWVWEQGTGVFAPDGTLLHLEGFITDVTERRRAEQRLAENEARFRALFEDSPVPLWEEDFSGAREELERLRAAGVQDLGTYLAEHPEVVRKCAAKVRVVSVNRATLSLYQARSREQLLAGLATVFDDQSYEAFREELLALAAGRTHLEVEASNRTLEGERKDVVVRLCVAPGHEESLDRVVVSIVDLTEQRRMEEEIANARRLESLGVLAGGIAHDFNNFLAGIVTSLSVARRRAGAEAHKPLDDALQACWRARSLTQQLLTFSRGGAPIRSAVSMPELLRTTTEFALSGSNVKPTFHFADDLQPAAADLGQISQVIQNIVINAKHAMPQGGTLSVRARMEEVGPDAPLPLRAGRYVRVDITDEGVGIPEEHLRRIYDPYFTTKSEGSGLGLATAYSIVRRHEGHLGVTSAVGKGSTFRIHLPCAHGSAPAPSPERPRKPVHAGRILLMDDDALVRKQTVELLNDLGYPTEGAKDGREAVERFRQARETGHPFDAVVLDLTVPGAMGGAECLRRLREMDPRVAAVVSSGYAQEPILAEAEEHGFRAAVSKPYRVEELTDAVQRALQHRTR